MGVKDIFNEVINNLKFTKCVVAISHTDYLTVLGGTEKFLQEEQALLAERNISYIQVYPLQGIDQNLVEPGFQLIGLNVDGKKTGHFTLNVVEMLLEALCSCGVSILAVHIHHLLGLNPIAVAEILKDIKAETRFFLHDYHSACPQYNFLKNNFEYCGGPPVNSTICEDCCWGSERAKHYNAYNEFFAKTVTSFIAPSEIAKKVWGKSYPELEHKVRVVPHQIHKPVHPQSFPSKRKLRIAYVGYQGLNKGWNAWRELVYNIGEEYELYHIGDCRDKLPSVKHISVSFLLDGQDSMTKALRKNQIDIAFLWSIWPETYSFTVFESLSSGCFVITNSDSGNIAAQVLKTGRGIVLEDEAALKEFLLNSQGVADLIKKNQESFKTFDLVFNPEIPNEESKKIDKDNLYLDAKKAINCFEKYDHLRKNIEHEIKVSNQLFIVLQKIQQLQQQVNDLKEQYNQISIEMPTVERWLFKYSNSLILVNVAWIKRVLTNYPKIKKFIKFFLFR